MGADGETGESKGVPRVEAAEVGGGRWGALAYPRLPRMGADRETGESKGVPRVEAAEVGEEV